MDPDPAVRSEFDVGGGTLKHLAGVILKLIGDVFRGRDDGKTCGERCLAGRRAPIENTGIGVRLREHHLVQR